MYGDEKSDRPIVPVRPANKAPATAKAAEQEEERGLAKGNPRQGTGARTQRREPTPQQDLRRIREAAARRDRGPFTSLWHHVYNIDRLRTCFDRMSKKAAAGVDGETWASYAENLEDHLQDLSERLARGAYRAKPVRRIYIPKADGRERALGIPTLEDKLVQTACAEVMGAIFETDFAGFSYGFRPGRGAHMALDALTVAIERKKVNWVLDADIRGFFDCLDHEILMKQIEHRIEDRRVLRHIKKWLNAGVLEDGRRHQQVMGTPQGGSISPLLANIYLHYALDRWLTDWRQTKARGEVIVVRYADDFVLGFQHGDDARRCLEELHARLEHFRLELHPDKTRLIEFGRFAAENRQRRGDRGAPDTFDFLGFTYICGKTRKGKFRVVRKTMRKRANAKLKQLKATLRKRMHAEVPKVGAWLRRVLEGHYNYYGVPGNSRAMSSFRDGVTRLWYTVLRRRSQKARLTWERMDRLARRWLPRPTIRHPYPRQRFDVRHPRQEPSAVVPLAGICAGGPR